MVQKISELGEFGLIDFLTKEIENKDPNIVRDFGDDTAFIRFGDEYLLFTVDSMVEDVHFLRWYNPTDVGWKLVSVNVSDVAAKGGKPLYGLITTALPPDLEVDWAKNLYKGIAEALNYYGFSLIGGNTSKSEKIFLDFPLVGKAKRVILRDTPIVGDTIWVSGTLGDSRAGLEILLSGKKELADYEKVLVKRHLRPMARLDLAPVVEKFANASMDISDGFISDLRKMCKNFTAEVSVEKLPLSEVLIKYCSEHGKNPYEYALVGGEDYQLLVCSDKNLSPYGFTAVGKITSEGNGEIYDERGNKLKIKGFDHLKV
jgi:thiamine-monophosphate kinase